MSQPLVTRPAYGHGGSLIAESGLPGGGPSDRGLPLDSGIPGTQTFAKPVKDVRETDKDDESIHRVDGPDDIAKDRNRVDTVEDNANKHDGIGQMGKGEWDTTNKTKYPYRDDRPNQHYAALSPETVMGLWLLRTAHELVIPAELPVRVAAKMSEIMRGLNPKTRKKAKTCVVAIKKQDHEKLQWVFSVNCGNGPKMVRLEADRTPRMTLLASMDLRVRCSCPAWEWLGPEHHAKADGYLKGKARGTASKPEIRDIPKRNRVCKHVAAVMQEIKEWDISTKDED